MIARPPASDRGGDRTRLTSRCDRAGEAFGLCRRVFCQPVFLPGQNSVAVFQCQGVDGKGRNVNGIRDADNACCARSCVEKASSPPRSKKTIARRKTAREITSVQRVSTLDVGIITRQAGDALALGRTAGRGAERADRAGRKPHARRGLDADPRQGQRRHEPRRRVARAPCDGRGRRDVRHATPCSNGSPITWKPPRAAPAGLVARPRG
jgi:hypothetical protein